MLRGIVDSVVGVFRSAPTAPKKTAAEMVAEGTCPVCGTEDAMLAGPEGGVSINTMCSACGTRLNYSNFFGTPHLDWTHGPQENIWGGGKATAFPTTAQVDDACHRVMTDT